ncbi:methionine adenosyltransferase [Shivajiella indica]|uniref:Methionine adenosyltransferase n=2 Tax=Shivajiella indica TaxID=872115 RepID=A0ABW5B4K8_9BACT
MVERKGIGHPDTICDQIAEEVSVELCKYYLEEFGTILHHNIDKALLVGGQAKPKFKGGKITQPIELFIAGRATLKAQGKTVPIDEIVQKTAKDWLKKHLRFLDIEKDIRIFPKIREGSPELVELFQRFSTGEIPLANDTSFGVGFYPPSSLEKKVLEIENLLNNTKTKDKFPFIGEDIKVMGLKEGKSTQFTIAIAMVDRFMLHIEDYQSKISSIKHFLSTSLELKEAEININTADDYKKESVYLTVSGTSAENGDDGQVGRGNRINGLITPYRPMSLEATAGKNPISHVGKIYNYFAFELSKEICQLGFADTAQVFIVSKIGMPITEPTILEIKLDHRNASNEDIQKLARKKLEELPQIWKKILNAPNPFEPFGN